MYQTSAKRRGGDARFTPQSTPVRVCLDIGHPAHVHYFRNLIAELSAAGTHEFTVVARDRPPVHELLQRLGIPFVSRGTGSNNRIGKALYIPKGEWHLWRASRLSRADVLMGFASFYAAQVAALLGRPSLIFDDTEHARWAQRLYRPFATRIVTPDNFAGSLGPTHRLIQGFIELAYLHPNRFTPDRRVLEGLQLEGNRRFAILRFVDWNNYHDAGQVGLDLKAKRRLVAELQNHVSVFISSETPLPEDLRHLELRTPTDKIHSVVAHADLFVCESGTMATEAALLGVPTVHVSYVGHRIGNFRVLQDRFGLLRIHSRADEALTCALELLQPGVRETWQSRRHAMLASYGDVTRQMIGHLRDVVSARPD